VNAFGYSYTSDIEEKSTSPSFPLTASNIATALANSQSGVIVSLNGGSHYLVITGDRGVSYSDPNDRFIICDPGTTNTTYGDNVPWSSSSSSYSFSDITKIYRFLQGRINPPQLLQLDEDFCENAVFCYIM